MTGKQALQEIKGLWAAFPGWFRLLVIVILTLGLAQCIV